jgi:hypothetical protein
MLSMFTAYALSVVDVRECVLFLSSFDYVLVVADAAGITENK